MRFVALVLVLLGCDRVFDLQHVDTAERDAPMIDTAGSGSSDARISDARPMVDAMIDAPIACPPGYTAVGTKLYKVMNTPVAYPIARDTCKNDELVGITRHTHLIVLDDENERVTLFSSFGANLWIGLVRIPMMNAFRPITDQPTTFPALAVPPFAGGEPSGQTGENCVRTVPQNGGTTVAGALADQLCTTTLKYVCECDDFKDNPAH